MNTQLFLSMISFFGSDNKAFELLTMEEVFVLFN